MMTKPNATKLSLDTDVLILGGGPAGTWAAITAARLGSRVILCDKGYCGTSGATAPAGTNTWYIPPDSEKRNAAMMKREQVGAYLTERSWMNRALDQTYQNMNQLANWGYPFGVDDEGKPYRGGLQGPDYMRLMRKLSLKAGVKILDHSPALELLTNDHSVVGAKGVQIKTNTPWEIHAGAVVAATGGCAFLSKSLGTNLLTGDGYLMAAEAGADMSGMEFSSAYAISPIFSSMTKTAFYNWASFYRHDGSRIDDFGGQAGRSEVARALIHEPVFASIDKVTEDMKSWLPKAQPNFFIPFQRKNINPFTDKFQITMRLEGTVRGTGGIMIADESCATSVPGLFAAGDAATRELICGSFTGGGSHNSTWAMSSGTWAGEAAAHYSTKLGKQKDKGIGTGAASTPISLDGSSGKSSVEELLQAIQQEVMPLEKNWFRQEGALIHSLSKLDQVWHELRNGISYSSQQVVRARETAAMAATARWMYHAALARKESRGMHRRIDVTQTDPNQQHRLITGGLDQIWVKPEAREISTLL